MDQYDVIIVGGGLAGLTAALHLRRKNYVVAVFERQGYPHHKVCGEYVSEEVVPYLESLGVVLSDKVRINEVLLSTVTGKSMRAKLPLGGRGLSRFTFDDLMHRQAQALGTFFFAENITSITFHRDVFTVTDQKGGIYSARSVIGAYGKRDALDKHLRRAFAPLRSPWLAIKAHYKLNGFPDHLVGLHNFEGGYGGLSKIENGAINFCCLATYESFQKVRDIDAFYDQTVSKNPHLNQFLSEAEPLFPRAITIGQISFAPKCSVEDHILMCGDAAGLIHPLCGNGMAMAIHGAKIASELIDRYFREPDYGRDRLEKEYRREWEHAFGRRLWWGRRLQALALNPRMHHLALNLLDRSPFILNLVIQGTHGKMIAPI